MSIIRNNIVLWNKMMKENEEKVVDIWRFFKFLLQLITWEKIYFEFFPMCI